MLVFVVRPAFAQDAALCNAAGAGAEARYSLPAGLLRAIGRVESGRRDATTGLVAAWPWTINAEGRGHLYETAAEALAATRALQASGVASIDVGCFQVNLVHHPGAFPSLEDGFDPGKNADYAARLLVSLRERHGGWDGAIAAYHSANPERGGPYRDKVLAGWTGEPLGTAAPSPVAPAPPVGPVVVRMVAWTPTAGVGIRVWTPTALTRGPAVIAMPRPTPRG